MNLSTYAAIRSNEINGKKLTHPQLNLLTKLDATGAQIDPDNDVGGVTNPTNGYCADVGPFIAALINWVYKTYATYGYDGSMSYRGKRVTIQLFDRTRYLILALDNEAFRNFID